MKTLTILITFLFCHLCYSQSDEKIQLEGTWLMDLVLQGENDVTSEHNPEGDRFIIFFEDGTFESGGSPYGKNTGKFYYDGSKNRLMLDSDAGEGDDSMWKVEFEAGKMYWRGIGSDWAEAFKIIHKKAKT